MNDNKSLQEEWLTKEHKPAHHGRNVKTFREWYGWSQEELGSKIGLAQYRVCQVEQQEVIEDDILEKIALAMNLPVDFLRTFDLNQASKNFTMSMPSPTLTNTSAENSHDTVNQQIVGEQNNEYNTTNHYHPVEQIVSVYSQVLEEKDKRLEEKNDIIEEKDKQINELKAKLNIN